MSVRAHICFYLDGELHEAKGVNPCTTVLDYLREHLGRTGTKEGCAEGDCGACTVVVAEPAGGRLQYRAVNACIAPLATIDGLELLTVESIGRDGLHPVQQAMVEHHGSQCGFCTPGIVMSLFAQYKTAAVGDRPVVDTCLSGNLCRCTGYRPIVDAALAMDALGAAIPEAEHTRLTRLPGSPPDWDENAMVDALSQLRGVPAPEVSAPTEAGDVQTVHIPRDRDEAIALYAKYPDATLIAGSSEVGVWLNKDHRDLGTAIMLSRVSGMNEIVAGEEAIAVGASAPLSLVHAALIEDYPELDEHFTRFASPPVRNVATLGGNLVTASPIGDMAPVLMALGAVVELESREGQRRMRVDEFFTGYRQSVLRPGELMTCIHVPRRLRTTTLRVYKLARRFDQDISAVCAAFAMDVHGGRIEDARIAYGGVAPTPVRLSACEAVLRGADITEPMPQGLLAALDNAITPISDVRASARYRQRIAANLMRRLWLELNDEPLTRVHDVMPEMSI